MYLRYFYWFFVFVFFIFFYKLNLSNEYLKYKQAVRSFKDMMQYIQKGEKVYHLFWNLYKKKGSNRC